MKGFRHVDATSVEEAVQILAGGDARIIAGGTNILPLMKLGVASPGTLVNIKGIPGVSGVTLDERGLSIGALTTVDSLTRDPAVKKRYPMLAVAASSIASPQIRNVATVGGNLTQEPRCWYYRGVHPCWLKGGVMCYAAAGENQKHAILGAGACNSVQPSDLAPALVALGAEAEVASPRGNRAIPVGQLFRSPEAGSRRLSTLERDELLTRVFVPLPAAGEVGVYVKKMERRVWAFASASIAARLRFEGGAVSDARLVLGGVSQVPWRLGDVEKKLIGEPLSNELIADASNASTAGARPLAHNAYKIALTRAIVGEALGILRRARTRETT